MMYKDEDELPDNIKKNLKVLVDHFTLEDKAVRERQIRNWRRLKLYWDGFTRIWYSETAHDWRVYDFSQTDQSYADSYYYDKTANVFRAYLESIIAALSIIIPAVRCAPDDADNPLDITTAKAGNKIAQLLYKHNNAQMLWLHALYVFCTEGMVASYTYPKEDKEYGTYETNEYKTDEVMGYQCTNCGIQLSDEMFSEREMDEFKPGEDDAESHAMIQEMGPICPECGAALDPELQKTKLTVERLVGVTHNPKTRQCIEVYGGLYVKVPSYAMKQSDIPYLHFSYETHYANALEMYPHLREKLVGATGKATTNSGIYDPYERWGRLSTQYLGEYPNNNVTVRNCWYRPSAYNVLATEEEVDELRTKFPDGIKVVFIDESFAHACNESLDDCWTLSYNPLSDYLHHDPLGNLLTSVQDIINDLISLVIQTIEHGIPQTAVDPAVLDVTAYNQLEIAPGMVFPTKPVPAGTNIANAFYQFKASALGEEVLPAFQQFQQLGQLASGALPSLFGGTAEAGSKTASEYSMSRSQALQRLQNHWKSLNVWWKDTFAKSILSYIKDMSEDERVVEKDKMGNYINTFIRKAETQGKIGEVELESSENLPVSWAQVKDVVMKIMELQNPVLLQALFSIENLPLVKEALGLTDFKLPGEDSRQKQHEEIQLLLQSEPIQEPVPEEVMFAAAESGMPPPPPLDMPSVPIDPELDEHSVEAEVCRRWLISEPGRQTKLDNPPGYFNVLLHFKQHMQQMQMQMMQQMQQQAAMQQQSEPGKDGVPPEKGNGAEAENGIRTPVQ